MPSNTFDEEEMVAEFHEVFEASNDPAMWAGLIDEEFKEVVEAAQDTTQPTGAAYFGNLLKESADLTYVMLGWALVAEAYDPEGKTFDEARFAGCQMLLDTVVSVVGPEALKEAFQLVHESNMSKLGDDGKPVRREDGKVLKGPNYKAPDMIPLGRRVYNKLNFSFAGVAA